MFCEICCSLMCLCSNVNELERGHVRVETDEHGTPIRIFRKDTRWLGCPDSRLQIMSKDEAVKSIREQCFKRSKGECEFGCGKYITWFTMELHEQTPKGKGGEVSLTNSVAICHDCHTGTPTSAHGNRRWHTAKIHQG